MGNTYFTSINVFRQEDRRGWMKDGKEEGRERKKEECLFTVSSHGQHSVINDSVLVTAPSTKGSTHSMFSSPQAYSLEVLCWGYLRLDYSGTPWVILSSICLYNKSNHSHCCWLYAGNDLTMFYLMISQPFPSGLWVAAQSLSISGTLQTQTHMYVCNKTSIIYTNWREGLFELTKSKKGCFITFKPMM